MSYTTFIVPPAKPTVAPSISRMSMKELKPRLCDKAKGDPYECIGCPDMCKYGERINALIEEETKVAKDSHKKSRAGAGKKLAALKNYYEVMRADDPVKCCMDKFHLENEKLAKNKLYQWQHNYGMNPRIIEEKINELTEELKAIAPVVVEPEPEKQEEPQKISKRQQEKISQEYLQRARADLENEFLAADEEIERCKKTIDECEQKKKSITEQIQAIRSVLDIFNAKDKLYT